MNKEYCRLQSDIIIGYFKVHGYLPPRKMFTKIGGDLKWCEEHYYTYKEFCREIGYGDCLFRYGFAKRYSDIYANNKNKVIFTGTFKEVYDTYFREWYTENYTKSAIVKHVKMRGRYYLVKAEKVESRKKA